MKSSHRILFQSAEKLTILKDNSIELMVTSPPYPMIAMWDEIFSLQNPAIKTALEQNNGEHAFDLMHKELFKIWEEVFRVVKPGGIACINIGDATRSIGKKFQLYSSHSVIINQFNQLGFHTLPGIIWRKQNNSPNKFMGSGMLPPNAYVTLEHEYILIFRKENKRNVVNIHEKELRNESSFFWEERNIWFSDLWDIKGISQGISTKNQSRDRSAAFPFDLVYRLINMYSIKGDTVLDPFLGTGTTAIAAMIAERNSIGIEIDPNMKVSIQDRIADVISLSHKTIKKRIEKHEKFIEERKKIKEVKHINRIYNFPVVTSQEINLHLKKIKKCQFIKNFQYSIEYFDEGL